MVLTLEQLESRIEEFMDLVYAFDVAHAGPRANALDSAIRAQFLLALLEDPIRIKE